MNQLAYWPLLIDLIEPFYPKAGSKAAWPPYLLATMLQGGRKPEIFHSDQGCQYTSGDFVGRLQSEAIKVSWSGRKQCYDNILVERLWRTVQHEEANLRA